MSKPTHWYDIRFSEVILAMEAELEPDRHGDAYCWMDKHHDGAFTKLIDWFENELVEAKKTYNAARLEAACLKYKTDMTGYFRKFRESHKISEREAFLSMLENTGCQG